MEMILDIKKNQIGQVVSARELYKFLELSKRFSTWIEVYIKENNVYGFIKNEDFTPYLEVHPQNLQEIQDYLLTIDMAKELSMVSKSEKGRQARKYFIACEKKYVELLENKTSLPNFSQLNYEKGLVYVKGVLNNLKSRLIFEKTEIEIKLKELEDTGLTDEIKAYVINGKIQVIQDL